jgi:RHS repeat-associated protein
MSKTSGASTSQSAWDSSGSLPLLLKDGTTAYVYGPSGLPLEQVTGAATYYFHHDQLGSTRLLTDATGAVQAAYTYDPSGNLVGISGAITNPLQYVGQYTDSKSGLQYLRARYYDPTTEQFISRDPIVATTPQPYSYAANSPTNGSDPTGLWCVGTQGGTAGLLGNSRAGGWSGAFSSNSSFGACGNGDLYFAATVGGFGSSSPGHASCFPSCTQPTGANGLLVGSGVGVEASNDANSAGQLAGTFTRCEAGVGAGPGAVASYATGGNVSVSSASYGGVTVGAGATRYNTTTSVYSWNWVQHLVNDPLVSAASDVGRVIHR